MTETSTTINTAAADVVSAATQLDPTSTPRAQIQVNWHNCDETALRAIMAAFPDARWRPHHGGGSEWIEGQAGPVRLVAFAVVPDPAPVHIVDSLFEQVSA